MEKKEEDYYGIYFNKDIPKINKINQYHQKVKIQFEGKAYLIKRKKEEIIERVEMANEQVLKKEKDYEIEFINENNEIYYLRLRIETSFLCLLLWFLLGLVIILLLTKPVKDENSELARFLDYISLSVLQFGKNQTELEEKPEKIYDFDVGFQSNLSKEIHLKDTILSKGSIKSKIAPRNQRKFLNFNGCFT